MCQLDQGFRVAYGVNRRLLPRQLYQIRQSFPHFSFIVKCGLLVSRDPLSCSTRQCDQHCSEGPGEIRIPNLFRGNILAVYITSGFSDICGFSIVTRKREVLLMREASSFISLLFRETHTITSNVGGTTP